MPSFGSVGDGYDNAMMESFWSSMQIELLNRKKWKTRVELANAIFEYIEIFYNRQRRHSSIDYRTPIEHELRSEKHPIPPETHHRKWKPSCRAGQRVNRTFSSPHSPVDVPSEPHLRLRPHPHARMVEPPCPTPPAPAELTRLRRHALIVVDEVSSLASEQDAANLLFQLVSSRC